jgi:hypothetical protein
VTQRGPTGASVVALEIEWLDRLRAKLEPNIDAAVATLVELAQHADRDSVRVAAAGKIVGLYAQCAADSGKLKLADKAPVDEDDKFRVLVVTQEQLADASAIAALGYQAKRLEAKDVS